MPIFFYFPFQTNNHNFLHKANHPPFIFLGQSSSFPLFRPTILHFSHQAQSSYISLFNQANHPPFLSRAIRLCVLLHQANHPPVLSSGPIILQFSLQAQSSYISLFNQVNYPPFNSRAINLYVLLQSGQSASISLFRPNHPPFLPSIMPIILHFSL